MMVKRVLIVEDEPLIAMMLEDFLEVLGKQPVASVDCIDRALARLSEGGIDAAILDVHLRQGEKSDTIATALAEAGIPFVFASGGSGDAIPDGHRDRPILLKPFTMDGVARALDALG